MLTAGGLAQGLLALPSWLDRDDKGATFQALFCGWAGASGYRSAGIVWPTAAPSVVCVVTKGEPTGQLDQVPAELPQVVEKLTDGPATVVWPVPQSAGRLYTLFAPPGRPAGVLFAERAAGAWSDTDRSFVVLSARLIERSAVLAAVAGTGVEPDRLNQRLGDAAVIAGRMAHDFDNILTGIIGFADLTIPLVPVGSTPARFAGEIAKVGHRGIAFTQQLHQLSRSGGAKPSPGGVPAAFAKEQAKLKPAAGTVVAADLPAGLPATAMEAGPLGIVLGHLMANAVEATPAGGLVTVTGRAVELTEVEARSYLGAARPGPAVEVTVADSGPGIKPDTRAKLFAEPFVTTKVRHRGLGLAIVYRTLVAHKGGVRLESAPPPGTGTVARFVVPPAAAPAPVAVPSAPLSNALKTSLRTSG